jgi:hypothetical protein
MRLPTLGLVASASGALFVVACSDSRGADAADAGADSAIDVVAAPSSARVELPRTLASGLLEPRGLVLVGDTLYVAERGAGRVVALPRAGGTPHVFAAGLHRPTRLATDGAAFVVTESEGGNMLWIDSDGHVRPLAMGVAPGEIGVREGEVFSLEGAADAGALVRRTADGGARTIATALVGASGLALDGDHAYFTASGAGGAKGSVFDAPRDGDAASPIAVTPEQAVGLAVDDGHVYWAARKGTSVGGSEGWIRRADVDGGEIDALVEVAYGPDRVAVRGDFVYFTNYQTLARAPLAGGPREDLALHTSVAELVVTDDAVYWTDADAGKLHAIAIASKK